MSEPVNNKNFGGVNFNWNQVKSAKVIRNKDGEETYFIEFKTGVTAEYPLQHGARMSSVPREFSFMNLMRDVASGDIDYDTKTELSFIKGATIKGSSKEDHIVGEYIKDCTIDVSGDNNDDHVDIKGDSLTCRYENGKYINSDSYNGSHDNKVVLDKHDTMTNIERVDTTKDGKYEFSIWGPKTYETKIEGPGVENRF